MQFCHSPITQVLASAHRVGKVNAPVIAIVHISHRRGYATLGHDGMSLAEKGFRNHSDPYSGCRGFDCGAQSGTSRSNDDDVVLVRDVFGH
jgi:hypothetical protein